MAELAELGEEDEHLLFSELRIVEARADARCRGSDVPESRGEAQSGDGATGDAPTSAVAEATTR